MLSLILTLLPSTPARVTPKPVNQESIDDSSDEGLHFRLSEGSAKVEKPKPGTVVRASPLSEKETQKLLARLPNLKPEASDVQDFKLREGSLLPPRAGETIQAAFALPTPNAPPALPKTTAPLEVLRYAPEGEVALAPALSITFSQPMIAVSSQEEAAANVPVTLTPQPKGRWRWLGTQTLIFQPEAEGGRLPMATNYTVTIPAGTKSALGNVLSETKTFNFATPPPTLKSAYPRGQSQPRDALMFFEFDQRIDAARVLAGISLRHAASGTRLRLATPEEIAANETLKELVKQSQDGRWLALRAVDANGSTKDVLPADTEIQVVIPPGTPSVEGSRVTTIEQSITFRTYGLLRVTDTQCGYQKSCSPFDQFGITFSNQLDLQSIPASKVTITPQIPGVKINAYGNTLHIEGVKRSNTTYTVTLDPSIKDNFGQTLTGNNQLTFKVTTAPPMLSAPAEGFTVLDPAARRTFNVYSVNYHQLRVRLYKVAPEDWPKYRGYVIALQYQKEKVPSPPGTLVFDKIIDMKSQPDELAETAINLSPALTNGYGQVLVQVEPVDEKGGAVRVYAYRPNGRIEAWVQATDIGLDAFTDKGNLVAWANSLKDGTPLAGVEMTVMPDESTAKTDAQGLARFSLKAPSEIRSAQQPLLIARRGDDAAILPQSVYGNNYNSLWRRTDKYESLSWYVFDDRKLYRPGEEVNVKGWVRQVNLIPTGDTELFAKAGETVHYVLKDSQDNEITKGSVKLNALSGFNLKLQLPATMNLGSAHLEFELY